MNYLKEMSDSVGHMRVASQALFRIFERAGVDINPSAEMTLDDFRSNVATVMDAIDRGSNDVAFPHGVLRPILIELESNWIYVNSADDLIREIRELLRLKRRLESVIDDNAQIIMNRDRDAV